MFGVIQPAATERHTAMSSTFGTPLVEDPDLSNLDTVEPSDLEALRDELAATVTPTVTLPVTGRPGYSVQYRTDFTSRELDSLRKRCKDKRFVDGIDGVKFSALLLGLTCQGIARTGIDLADVLGVPGPVTFTTKEFQELLGTTDADSTVRKLYGLEGHVDSAGRRLMDEAGWGEETYAADPTE